MTTLAALSLTATVWLGILALVLLLALFGLVVGRERRVN